MALTAPQIASSMDMGESDLSEVNKSKKKKKKKKKAANEEGIDSLNQQIENLEEIE
jgi:hypothetical protein